ncbi:AAA family ATPase [Moritella viscosa]|uniref:AAA family ATPase n=1 Tax=Moritella viscosa TaxID=80854 RepID=UPI0009145BD0|nr:AAA family ATPase [Moritella viscosa]SGZ02094.1 5-methylcytosine-specific restriction enzyme B [Moritella viscosa]
MANDSTQYNFNGINYGKGPLVFAVIKQYIEERKPTFSALGSEFSKDNISFKECVISRTQYKEKHGKSEDVAKRYFLKKGVLTTSDGVEVLVNSQWSIDNINDFICHVNSVGFTVLAVQDGETILSRFKKYKENPHDDWINAYQQRCNQVKAMIGKDTHEYSEQFIEDLWKATDNGVASVSPGALSNEEYAKLLPELPKITKQILDNPTQTTLNSVYEWAKKAKLSGTFSRIKWGVIHRVFAAANPQKITTLLGYENFQNLIKVLNQRFGFDIALSGNWIEINIALKAAFEGVGVKDENPIIVNTFAWKLFIDLVQNQTDKSEPQSKVRELFFETAKNKILYGPPGTGKTYRLQQLTQNEYTSENVILDKSLWLKQQLEQLSWFEIVVLVLFDLGGESSVTSVVQHEYFQLKAALNARTSNLAQTAWAALQAHTTTDSLTVKYDRRTEPLVFNKTDNSLWFIVDKNDEQLSEYKQTLAELNAGPQSAEVVKRFEFITFHQSYGYEEFVEGLRPVTNGSGDINYVVEPGVFKRICESAKADPKHRYAIVIDEINRGNISKIFGELISLIETDKRAGSENELTVTLPYSKADFTVPANLDIIGTMNTADRSLAHIDIALRRRFEFEELRTDYSLLSSDIDGVNINRMLFAMNQRIELLLDRDHIIGHALLMNVDSLENLEQQFKTKILPLLEEYFFEDWGKINQVFNGNGIVKENKNARSIWLGNTDEYAAKTYSINDAVLGNSNTYQKIYVDIDDKYFTEVGL